LITKFIDTDKYNNVIKKAIENHNKKQIEEGLSDKELLHAKIIRDADKKEKKQKKEILKKVYYLEI
ncbi:MAG: hypothetical protein J6C46_00165, partial [Clostridia bacterium]|nr:hypothetical protein [Clostridia bacterium]